MGLVRQDQGKKIAGPQALLVILLLLLAGLLLLGFEQLLLGTFSRSFLARPDVSLSEQTGHPSAT